MCPLKATSIFAMLISSWYYLKEEYILVCVPYMRWGESEECVLVCVPYIR